MDRNIIIISEICLTGTQTKLPPTGIISRSVLHFNADYI